jgi:SAM-dependent methyltransferase
MGNNREATGATALSRAKTFIAGARGALRDRGLRFFVERVARYGSGFVAWQYYKRRPTDLTFSLGGVTHRYFYHLYNLTWQNERALEIPVAWSEVQRNAGRRILEVGNVLSWYFPVEHDVLDKYERASGVINQDIVAFDPPEKYDLVVSVSTMEHVGWDETPRDPPKVLRAVEHLKTLLKPGGQLLLTVPIGYNRALDGFLEDGSLDLGEKRFMKKVSGRPEWVELEERQALAEVRGVTYQGSRVIMVARHRR